MTIYVDGSYSQEKKVLSYAFCVVQNEKEILYKSSKAMKLPNGSSTNAEIMAVVEALKYCINNNISEPVIVHDYDEILFFATGYRRPPNSMRRHVKELVRLKSIVHPSFKKVRAHDKDPFNNLVDELARQTMQEFISRENEKLTEETE
ncbi:MAG TPA: reverse transcriptase-like protein [Fervidobacterium sp.]|nr:reverse transcriptase-like protein [Fervidobacterium sp.]